MARNNHVKTMKKYIEQHMNFGECIITHKDILRETNANCCYSVLKALKNYYDIVKEEWIDKENCRYKKYTFKRKEVKNAEKTNLWGSCEACQLTLI